MTWFFTQIHYFDLKKKINQFFLQWAEVQAFDVRDLDEELEKRMENIYANDCCVLVYTVRGNWEKKKFKTKI